MASPTVEPVRAATVPAQETQAGSAQPPGRLDSLTSLRFFAAFAVFTHHFTGLGGSTGYGRAPLLFPYSQIGAYGVDFFFVLSGFLLTWIHRPGEPTAGFYWRRVGRIYPATLAALPFAILAYYTFAHTPINWPGLAASVLLIQTWFPHITPELPGNEVTWTLSVELLFYALFPLLIRAVRRLRTRTLLAAAAVGLLLMYAVCWWSAATMSGHMSGWVMRTPIVYLPVFGVGMVAATALRRGHRLPLHPAVPVLALFAYTIAYYQGRARLPHAWVAQLDYAVRPVVSLLSVLIVVAFAQREIAGLRGVLNNRLLVLLGVWSYSFYLLHHSVTRIAQHYWGGVPNHNSAIFTLIGFAVVVNLMAWALYRWVEEPCERWWRKHTPARFRRSPS